MPHSFMAKLFYVTGLTMAAGFMMLSNALALDASALFEERCSKCHQSAEKLAEMTLIIDHGVLRSSATGKDMRAYLPHHRGHPNPEETLSLYDLMFSKLISCPNVRTQDGGGFETRCAICHPSALDLAKQKLIRVDGTVRGRYSGRELSEFLDTHARICTDDGDYFIHLLGDLAPSIEANDQ